MKPKLKFAEKKKQHQQDQQHQQQRQQFASMTKGITNLILLAASALIVQLSFNPSFTSFAPLPLLTEDSLVFHRSSLPAQQRRTSAISEGDQENAGAANRVRSRNMLFSPSSSFSSSSAFEHKDEEPLLTIAVATTRDRLSTHAAAVARTWALTATRRYHKNVQVKFFVGNRPHSQDDVAEPATTTTTTKTTTDDTESIVERAKAFGLKDTLHVLPAVDNVESTAYQKALLSALAVDAPSWTYVVSDQVYVHVQELLDLLSSKDPRQTKYYGVPAANTGERIPGIQRAVCAHDPGYIFSRPMLLNLAHELDACDQDDINNDNVDNNKDAAAGVAATSFPILLARCIEKFARVGCAYDADFIVHESTSSDTTAFLPWSTSRSGKERLVTVNLTNSISMEKLHRTSFTLAMEDPNIPPWKRTKNMPHSYVFDNVDAFENTYGVASCSEPELKNVLEKLYFNNSNFEVKRCMTCERNQDEFWFMATSNLAYPIDWMVPKNNTPETTAAAVGRVHSQCDPIHHSESVDHGYTHMDFIVPFYDESQDKLIQFVVNLAQSVKRVNDARRVPLEFRLLVTKYSSIDEWLVDNGPSSVMTKLMKKAKQAGIDIGIVSCQSKFSRARAVNALLRSTCSSPTCLVGLIDVDEYVGPSLIRHAVAFVHPSTTAYVPIDFAMHHPEAVAQVEDVIEKDVILRSMHTWHDVDYKGMWKRTAYGQVVMAGPDAQVFRMDEDFEGWGGEDNAWFRLLTDHLNVVRIREQGLIHQWHDKDCRVGSSVQPNMVAACLTTVRRVEGSILGAYLRKTRKLLSPMTATQPWQPYFSAFDYPQEFDVYGQKFASTYASLFETNTRYYV